MQPAYYTTKSLSIQFPLALPVVFLLGTLFLLGLPVAGNWHVGVFGLGLTATGFLVYALFVLPTRLPTFVSSVDGEWSNV